MRDALVRTADEMMAANPNLYFLTGDLGFMAFEPLQEKFRERFINVGVAEANMIGVAGGLARMGKKVICYSMIPFVTMRCLEQIRIHLSIGKADITLIGVGAGYGYGIQGSTHHAIEDIGIMAALPNLVVLSPATPYEAAICIQGAISHHGPAYVRLGKAASLDLEYADAFSSRKINLIKRSTRKNGAALAVLVTGTVIGNALQALDTLGSHGETIALYSVPALKPFDVAGLKRVIAEHPNVVTVELNVEYGGLGSIVALQAAKLGLSMKNFTPLSISDEFIKSAGSMNFLEAQNNLHPAGIAKAIESVLGNV